MKVIFITYFVLNLFKNSHTFDKIKNLATGLCLEGIRTKQVFTNYCGSFIEQNWIKIGEQYKYNILYYQLYQSSTRLCLDSDNISKIVSLNECNERDSQKWAYNPQSKDLQNADNGLCLESGSNNRVFLNNCNALTFKKWFLYEENIIKPNTNIDAFTNEIFFSKTITDLYTRSTSTTQSTFEKLAYENKNISYANGDSYQGEMINDKMNGKGIYYYSNGNKYEGDFQDDKKNGKGIFFWANGEKYDGEWKDDKRNGKGIFIRVNGEKTEGEWKDDERIGIK